MLCATPFQNFWIQGQSHEALVRLVVPGPSQALRPEPMPFFWDVGVSGSLLKSIALMSS